MVTTQEETTVSQVGNCQNQSMTTLSTSSGERRNAQQVAENIIKDLSYLLEHIDLKVLSSELEAEMIAILNVAEELDVRLESIASRMEASVSGEDSPL